MRSRRGRVHCPVFCQVDWQRKVDNSRTNLVVLGPWSIRSENFPILIKVTSIKNLVVIIAKFATLCLKYQLLHLHGGNEVGPATTTSWGVSNCLCRDYLEQKEYAKFLRCPQTLDKLLTIWLYIIQISESS